MRKEYLEMLNMEHPISKKHPRMSLEARAAQFAPFAALTGYDDAVKETERLTEKERFLSETKKEELDRKFAILADQIHDLPEVTITYYVPDLRKTGGSYRTVTGYVKRIDLYQKYLWFFDGTMLDMEQIYDIESNVFEKIMQ